MVQVLCKVSNSKSDIRCKVCEQGFLVYWARTAQSEREEARREILIALEEQHRSSASDQVHPRTGFTVPNWNGIPAFSGAALLGGAPGWAI